MQPTQLGKAESLPEDDLVRALVYEAGDLLDRLPPGEAEQLTAMLRYSSTAIALTLNMRLYFTRCC